MKGAIKNLSIAGFKSIRELKDLELKNLNVLIGANGAGKSNFIQVFRMLMAMSQKNFQKFILENGGADSFLHNGPKVTERISSEFVFESHSDYRKGNNQYRFTLTPTVEETFLISEEREYVTTAPKSYGSSAPECQSASKIDPPSAAKTDPPWWLINVCPTLFFEGQFLGNSCLILLF